MDVSFVTPIAIFWNFFLWFSLFPFPAELTLSFYQGIFSLVCIWQIFLQESNIFPRKVFCPTQAPDNLYSFEGYPFPWPTNVERCFQNTEIETNESELAKILKEKSHKTKAILLLGQVGYICWLFGLRRIKSKSKVLPTIFGLWKFFAPQMKSIVGCLASGRALGCATVVHHRHRPNSLQSYLLTSAGIWLFMWILKMQLE